MSFRIRKKPDLTTIGGRIKSARLKKQLTQRELSIHCGVTTGSIIRIENNTQYTKRSTLEKICECLDLDINYVYTGIEDIDRLRDENRLLREKLKLIENISIIRE